MKKLLSTTIAVGIFASMSVSPVLADVSATALPSLNSAVDANVSTSNSTMNVQINAAQGGTGTLNWNSYNVGSDATVNYEFTAHNQTALNKVDAAGGLSQIYGNITSSGCSGCGYDATGKVILINPNGVLFGNGANVNLNSFTVSTLDGTYDSENNKLILTKGSNQSDAGITVDNGATIYGDKGVTFASNNVTLYNGSKISTNVGANVTNDDSTTSSYGKVKIVTGDGVTFTYYNNGAVKGVSDVTASADQMLISVNGEIESGQIDIRNYSTNSDSAINLNGATLKAVKAVEGNDGNIWLTSSNNIIVEDSTFETTNQSTDAADVTGGNIKFLAGNKVSVGSSDLDAVGDISLISQGYDVAVDGTTIDTAKDVTITAGGVASLQNAAEVNAKNVTLTGGDRAQAYKSTVNAANDIEITADNVWLYDSTLKAAGNINATATDGYILANDAVLEANKITLDAATNVTGTIDLSESQANIYAANDIDVTLENVGNRDNGLVAKAGNDMTITTDGTLSVSSLISGNDMTINADKVIAGLPYTSEIFEAEGDSADRSYIEVGGTFTSNVTNDNYEVTASTDLIETEDGQYNQRHHIQYGEDEKILLVNKLPYEADEQPDTPVVTPDPDDNVADNNTNDDNNTITVSFDNDLSTMLNKLPRQPESYSNVTNISDGRTTFVDVFAAASQIEIVDDED